MSNHTAVVHNINVKYPIRLKDENGNVIYFENSCGYSYKKNMTQTRM